MLSGCYSRVYFKSYTDAVNAFDTSKDVQIKQVRDVHNQHYGLFEARYKPFK